MTAPLQRWVIETHFPADMTADDITALLRETGAAEVRFSGPPSPTRFCSNVTAHAGQPAVARHMFDGEPICWGCLMRGKP